MAGLNVEDRWIFALEGVTSESHEKLLYILQTPFWQAERVLANPWSELIDLPPSAVEAGVAKPSKELLKPEQLQVSCMGPPCSYMQAAQMRSSLLIQRANASACKRVLHGDPPPQPLSSETSLYDVENHSDTCQ